MAGESERDAFPARCATSEQIRNFFAQFLSSTTIVSTDKAKAWEIANQWPLEATGIQLWTFSLQKYNDIFGQADGMLLWSHIHGVTEDDKKVIVLFARTQPTSIEKNLLVGFFLFLALFSGWIASYQSSLFTASAFQCIFSLGIVLWMWLYLGVSPRRQPRRTREGNA